MPALHHLSHMHTAYARAAAAAPPSAPDSQNDHPDHKENAELTGLVNVHLACPAGQSLIADIIDFEQEDDNKMINYNICSQLDELKHSYHGLPSLLTRVVESELQVCCPAAGPA